MNSKIESLHSALPENIEAVRYDLEQADNIFSARLVDAAAHDRWKEEMLLLLNGTDPRVCRYTGDGHCKSALYFALKAENFDAADALLKAGDRLDDLRVSGNDALPGKAVNFLVRAEANGNHVFAEKDKPLSECIRCGLWEQSHAAIKNASRKELNLSVEMIALYLQPWNAPEYLQLLDELQTRGANLELLALFREEIQQALSSLPQGIQAEFIKKFGKFITEDNL